MASSLLRASSSWRVLTVVVRCLASFPGGGGGGPGRNRENGSGAGGSGKGEGSASGSGSGSGTAGAPGANGEVVQASAEVASASTMLTM